MWQHNNVMILFVFFCLYCGGEGGLLVLQLVNKYFIQVLRIVKSCDIIVQEAVCISTHKK